MLRVRRALPHLRHRPRGTHTPRFRPCSSITHPRTHREGLIQIPVVPSEERSHVDVNDVAALQLTRVGDSMADDLVDRGAYRLCGGGGRRVAEGLGSSSL